ncbi:HlyD family secretion protein [Azohydromonas caseinilytica]|uniref:HlyD family efflux transporter periplasmic adaptor subunit n=1 Tax=Azohydromonas caseinilytica TaxID=2728836 RepID=A0A848FDT1_9BURK|nr:HlyD family efflux transporter periplasmic adaptor subunit [Azohydromonas caseinilytica]NML17604.1 HlyD family efflux transporter periplasmic adaptor subunit [Azohydromonas caseinilytica]
MSRRRPRSPTPASDGGPGCRRPPVVAATGAGRALAALLLAAALGGCERDREPVMSGYAEAELVYVSSAAAGTLRTVDVRRGQAVRQGAPLFTVEPEPDALGRDAAQARRERAQAQERNLRKGRRPEELRAIDAQLAQARAALSASASALQRQESLIAQGFVSPLQREALVAARDRDAARVRELEAQRRLATEAARSDEVAAAAAEARAAGADLALAQWREDQRTRAAPVDAQVFDVLYRPGEWVNAGLPVVALLPPRNLKVRFFVPEPLLARVAPGASVALACDGCPAGLRARVRWVSPQAEFTPPVIYSNASRSKLVFMAEADPAPGSGLKPGQPLDVRLAATPAPAASGSQ